jgi:hypothetical protein
MIKIGFELEEFYLVNDQPAVVPMTIPRDDCGWLVEYRSEPNFDPYKAIGSLIAEKEQVATKLPAGAKTLCVPYMTIPRKLKLEARRMSEKARLCFQNLYGLSPSTGDLAGLHVSFTHPRTIHRKNDEGGDYAINQIFDFVQLFRALDREYAKEIKEAKRRPGFYELKVDGRIEYRSLPNTLDLWKLAKFLKNYSY